MQHPKGGQFMDDNLSKNGRRVVWRRGVFWLWLVRRIAPQIGGKVGRVGEWLRETCVRDLSRRGHLKTRSRFCQLGGGLRV